MFRRTFYPDRFLESVYGTEPFIEYCHERGIDFAQTPNGPCGEPELQRWQRALSQLSSERQADIELELAQVNDLAHRDALYRLIDSGSERGLPPALIPGEAAQALWFLLHQPAVFQEVFFHEEILETESWHGARISPGLDLADHADRHPAFERELKQFFRVEEGTGRFCAAQSYRFTDPACTLFVGYVSDRLRFLEAFTDSGEHRHQRVRTAAQVSFAYYPADGTLLVKSRYRAPAKVLALCRAFARSVLGSASAPTSLGVRYDLDRLKSRFDPALPAEIAQVRVKALELAYPPAEGRRRVRLETNARDARFAILELLREHAGSEERLARLRVVQADLQVVHTSRGRARTQVIRLWPNRCSLNQTASAERLRRCLASWELVRAS